MLAATLFAAESARAVVYVLLPASKRAGKAMIE